jgi:hypothetical protein
MAEDQTLRILVKTEGDTAGLEKTKKGLDDLKGAASQASQAATIFGAAIGAAIPTTALAAVTSIIGYFKNAAEESRKLTEQINQQTTSLLRSAEAWNRFAQAVRTTGELTSLANSFASQLDRVNTNIEELTRKAAEVSGLRRVFEGVLNSIAEIGTLEESTSSVFATAADKQVQAAEALRSKMLAVQQQAVETANAQQAATAALAPTKEQVSALVTQIIALIEKQFQLKTDTDAGRAAWIDYQNQISALEGQIKSVTSVMEILDNQVTSLSADVDKQVRAGNAALEEEFELKNKLAEQAKDDAAAAAQQQRTAMLREEQTLLQGIRQEQEITAGKAFIGVDQKDAQLLRQYQQELVAVVKAMKDLSATRGTITDPVQLAQADQKMQQLTFHAQQLGQRITQAMHPLQSELQRWANSFGGTMTQVGHTIEQTVGVALQGLNQWIVTGKFNLQALEQQVIMLGLQLVEQLIIQRVVAMINARAAEAEAVASSKIIAAAWASAATAVTIATEGSAAYQAPGAVAIALAGVQTALGLGSLHEGGPVRRRRRFHGGGLADDEVPIIAQEGEIMIRRGVAQAPGMADFLLGLNEGAFHGGGRIRRMHPGGRVSAWDPETGDPREFTDWPIGTTSPRGQGPIEPGPGLPEVPRVSDPTIEPPDLPEPPDPGQPSTIATGMDPATVRFFEMAWGGFGTTPSTGLPAFGPTMLPTNWVNYPGVGLVPMALPVGWAPTGADVGIISGSRHMGMRKPKHEGGLISRYHDGGAISGGGAARGGVHIYAFTDLKQLTKHMASRDGQKIIFDTVNGRRIDLGMK